MRVIIWIWSLASAALLLVLDGDASAIKMTESSGLIFTAIRVRVVTVDFPVVSPEDIFISRKILTNDLSNLVLALWTGPPRSDSFQIWKEPPACKFCESEIKYLHFTLDQFHLRDFKKVFPGNSWQFQWSHTSFTG